MSILKFIFQIFGKLIFYGNKLLEFQFKIDKIDEEKNSLFIIYGAFFFFISFSIPTLYKIITTILERGIDINISEISSFNLLEFFIAIILTILYYFIGNIASKLGSIERAFSHINEKLETLSEEEKKELLKKEGYYYLYRNDIIRLSLIKSYYNDKPLQFISKDLWFTGEVMAIDYSEKNVMGETFILKLSQHGYIDEYQSFKLSNNITENELRTFNISDIKSLVLTKIVVDEVFINNISKYWIRLKRLFNFKKWSL